MTLEEALPFLKKGYGIRRASWQNKDYLLTAQAVESIHGKIRLTKNFKVATPISSYDVFGEDWEYIKTNFVIKESQ